MQLCLREGWFASHASLLEVKQGLFYNDKDWVFTQHPSSYFLSRHPQKFA